MRLRPDVRAAKNYKSGNLLRNRTQNVEKTSNDYLQFLAHHRERYNGLCWNFSGSDVKNVINAMNSIDDTRVPQAMKTLERFAEGDFEGAMDHTGDLALFRKMLTTSRNAPGEYSYFKTVARNNSFSSPE